MFPSTETQYRCSNCGKLYQDLASAVSCCIGDVCPECGGKRNNPLKTLCQACRYKAYKEHQDGYELSQWSSAKKIPLSVFVAEHEDEWLYDSLSGTFHQSADELVSYLYRNGFIPTPGFPATGVYATFTQRNDLDVWRIEEMLSDEAPEDYQIDAGAHEAIASFCESFNSKHAEIFYWPDYDIGIIPD
ncbi:MAG: hypothetical protein HFJ65_08540 [Eggerthellaceae bacterium]|nr:hypothetical protein [Eggerthellaceae bacterium]